LPSLVCSTEIENIKKNCILNTVFQIQVFEICPALGRDAFTNDVTLQVQPPTPLELHSRPKFLWTNLQWIEKNQYPKAQCPGNQHQNIMRYSKANALLRLPPCTTQASSIERAFLSAMFYGWSDQFCVKKNRREVPRTIRRNWRYVISLHTKEIIS